MGLITSYIELSLIYSLVAAVVIEAFVQIWKIKTPNILITLRQLILLIAVIGPVFNFIFLHSQNSWGIPTLPLITISALSGLIYFFQELLPAIREHSQVTHSGMIPMGDSVWVIPKTDADVFISGYRTPKIIVTEGLVSLLSPAELEGVIAHERIHIQKFDLVKGWILFILRSLMFFNPVILVEFRRLMNDNEMICDQLAIASTGDSTTYANALIKIAKSSYRVSFENESRMSAIKLRLEAILYPQVSGNLYKQLSVITLAVFVALAAANQIPRYIHNTHLSGEYADISSAEHALGAKIWVPKYFPSFLLWPPQSVHIEGETHPAISLFFGKQPDQYLTIYQSLHPGTSRIAIKKPTTIIREETVTINTLPATLTIGERSGKPVTQLSWDDTDRAIQMESNSPPEQLLRMARSMRP